MQASNDIDQSRSAVKELLLEDYRNFSESLWKNEQTGETRVNWFIGIVSAAAGGLIGLTSAEYRPHGEPLRLIFVAALFALLAFGIITLLRIMKRNETTDGYKRDSDNIRQMFKDYFDGDNILRQYHPFGKGDGGKDLPRKLGGLAHTVLTINGLILAGLAAAFVYPFGAGSVSSAAMYETRLRWTYGAAILAFSLAVTGQFFWVKRRDSNAKKKLRKPTHAGGIVYRPLKSGNVEYLLVGPKKDIPGEWVFPKGHIDDGEEQWETAVREVREETGTVGRPICPVGRNEFDVGEDTVVAKYYLMEAFSEAARKDSRRVGWFGFEQALKSLKHPDNQHLLRQAERKRRSLSGKESTAI